MSTDIPVSRMGYLHFLRVILAKDGDQLNAISLKLKGSGVISSLTNADGIVEILPHQEGLKKGDPVIVKVFPK
ncbi:MAG: hypothetical protein EU535_06940 [Promethearchaeota archaeon]|nr:MAG: hypothetical protein EU535_06940 [Candidatus Lokiarchaeota archaeon]